MTQTARGDYEQAKSDLKQAMRAARVTHSSASGSTCLVWPISDCRHAEAIDEEHRAIVDDFTSA